MSFTANKKEERTEYSIYKVFGDSTHNFSEEVLIWIPFEVLMDTVEKFCYDNYTVKIDGKATDVWNLFAGTNFIENLFEDDDFVAAVTEAYDNSVYVELDYYDWVDSEPWEAYEQEA